MPTGATSSHGPIKAQVLLAYHRQQRGGNYALLGPFRHVFRQAKLFISIASGLVVSSLSAKRRGRFRRQNGRQRENHSGIVAVKRSPPGRVILESYFENCRILALQFRLGAIRRRMGTNAALLNSKARPADRGCPKFQTFGGTNMPGTDLEWAIGFQLSTPDRRWDAPVRRMVSRLSQIWGTPTCGLKTSTAHRSMKRA